MFGWGIFIGFLLGLGSILIIWPTVIVVGNAIEDHRIAKRNQEMEE